MVETTRTPEDVDMVESVHWRLRMADLAIRWRFKRHAARPLDVDWARARIGRPLWMRRVITPSVERRHVVLSTHTVEVLSPPRTRASDSPERILLYVHGGGYIACSPSTHRPLAARLAREWNAIAVVPDYRLAPEHPYPAGRNDVLATWRWMLETLRVDPASVVFAGDSAGGGLALSAALACTAADLPMPAAIVAFSPWTDLACRGASLELNAERCAMFVPSQLRAAAALYAGATPSNDPGVSPLYGDLQTLPPLCLHVGRDELLRDDTLSFADRAREAGVEVVCRSWPNVPHVWQFLVGFLPEARESLDEARLFVRQHLPAHALTELVERVTSVSESPSARSGETRVPHA